MFLTLSTQSFCVIPLSSYLLPQLVSYASHISKKAGNDHSFVEPWFYYFLYTKRQSLGPGSGPEVCGSSDTSDPVLEALAPFVIKKHAAASPGFPGIQKTRSPSLITGCRWDCQAQYLDAGNERIFYRDGLNIESVQMWGKGRSVAFGY